MAFDVNSLFFVISELCLANCLKLTVWRLFDQRYKSFFKAYHFMTSSSQRKLFFHLSRAIACKKREGKKIDTLSLNKEIKLEMAVMCHP